MYLCILFLPLLSTIICLLFGRYIGRTGSQILSITLIFFTAFFSCIAFYEVGLNKSECEIFIMNWIDSELLTIEWSFKYDSLTVIMLPIITIISCLVHVFSVEYMQNDPHVQRFMGYLSLFTFFMLILVTGNNLLVLFVGWEGVGFVSYLLINFWFTRIQANKSAIKAVVLNRIGDISLIIGILLLNFNIKSCDYNIINSIIHLLQKNDITIISLCLFLAAMAKSAQIGLHTWLPDAMEGPTPVSALIHAATMVTAGVYLIIRCSYIFVLSPTILSFITFIGAITTLFAATSGLFQLDIKKIIAYSTCSQLGYMVFACGLGSFNSSIFHLFNHAFFKALLFLSAGVIIHAAGLQDLRSYNSLIFSLPLTYSLLLIASLSLAGFPFLTGFFSKDFILEFAAGSYTLHSSVGFFFASITVFITSLYSAKILVMTFFPKK